MTDFRLTSATALSRAQAGPVFLFCSFESSTWEAAAQLFEGSREMVELVEQEAAPRLQSFSTSYHFILFIRASMAHPRTSWWIAGWLGSALKQRSPLQSQGWTS